MAQRKIIHVDMDCFYAAIEIRDNPSLAGKPVAVGGPENSRGVLCTCNYEARKFGIHSAMASSHAVRLCPDLIILPVNFTKYREASREIHKIFSDYTDTIEPLSLDEAFLDVTDSSLFEGSATYIAQDIRNAIYQSQNITASAGIAPNKMLAKIASDWEKPNGQFVITPNMINDFMQPLPVKKLFGVGKVTAEKLRNLNIETCGDLQKWPLNTLTETFGTYGNSLYEMSRGIDNRSLVTQRTRKSLSVEHTYQVDFDYRNVSESVFSELFSELKSRLKSAQVKKADPIKTLFVKIKFSDFTTTTIQSPNTQFTTKSFMQLFKIRSMEIKKPVRLIGIGVHFANNENQNFYKQLSLKFEE